MPWAGPILLSLSFLFREREIIKMLASMAVGKILEVVGAGNYAQPRSAVVSMQEVGVAVIWATCLLLSGMPAMMPPPLPSSPSHVTCSC